MKSTRYSSYQPLLKVLAQAAIADRPEGWSEGELCLSQQGPALVCRLRRPEGGAEQPAPARVQAAAQALAQALAHDGLPWVGCRIGFFRKPVGWGGAAEWGYRLGGRVMLFAQLMELVSRNFTAALPLNLNTGNRRLWLGAWVPGLSRFYLH